MTVGEILKVIHAGDQISIQDSNGRIYNGLCIDFLTDCEWVDEVINHKVDRIRSYNCVTIIFC